jgi:uncharacterized protein
MAQAPRHPMSSDEDAVMAATRRWIAEFVIGLNLCPFARRVFDGDLIRYVVSDAGDGQALLRVLGKELQFLAAAPMAEVETTLLIHPHVLVDFLDYNDFLDRADRLLIQLDLRGVVQIASFHPSYQFAGADPDAAENYTNRSPYPMLHLLREESVSAVAGDPDELLAIPQRNIEVLRAIGGEKLRQKLEAIAKCGPSANAK